MKKLIILILFMTKTFASELEDSVRRLQSLKAEIDQSIEAAQIKCQEFELSDKDKKECRFVNFCKMYEKDLNRPIIYQNEKGEMLTNEPFFNALNLLNQCLREKNKDEIAAKVEAYVKKYGKIHLKKVWDENQKIKEILKKNKEESNLSKINQEILSIRLEDGISDGTIDRWNEGSRGDRIAVLALAEKRTKIKLSDELKQSLIKVQELLSNHQYKAEARKMERKIFPELYSDNVFADFDNFIDPEIAGSDKKLVENQKLYQKMAQKNYDIFLESKKEIVAYLKKKMNDKNKPMIERAIKKVELVKFQTPSLNKEYMNNCKSPNAWYDSDANTVTICPQWLNHPEADLRYTYLHELTHSIDACTFSFPLQIKKTSTQIVPEGEFTIDLKMERVKDSVGLSYVMKSDDLDSDDLPAVKFNSHPFSSVFECLKGSSSVGAKVPDWSIMQERLQKEKDFIVKNGFKNSDKSRFKFIESALKNFDKFKDHFEGCDDNSFVGPNQLGESFSDKVAFDILAERFSKLNQNEANEEIKKLLLTGMKGESAFGCPNNFLAAKIHEKIGQEKCEGYFSSISDGERVLQGIRLSSENDREEHPETFKRFERIFMTNPQVQKILGCKVKGGEHCE